MREIITLLSCIAPIIDNKNLKQLSIIIKAILTMNGRVTMLGLSRWSEKDRKAHVILFSTDLNLGYEKLIDYYSLRFQSCGTSKKITLK